jgi:fumarate reductase flavoprotein subunit
VSAGRVTAADVVVIGGGASGLAAAIEAAGTGASVVVLEKNAMPGGSSRLSVGSINAAGSSLQKRAGIADSPDAHFADMDNFMGAFADKENRELRRLLVDHAAETLEWLMSLGLSFYGPTADPPHRQPRMHNVLPNSRAYPWCLAKEAKRRGARMVLGARVLELLQADDGGVLGVVADIAGRREEFIANRGVVIAAGDYSNGTELKARFRPELAAIPGVNPTATGDGHRMAEAIGARIVNGEVVYGPSLRFGAPARASLVQRLPASWLLGKVMQLALAVLPVSLFRPLVMSFMTASLGPELALLRSGAILVNRDGERFIDEQRDAPGLAIAAQPGGQAWLVMDDAVARKFSRTPHHVSTAPGVAFAYMPDYKRHRKDLYRSGANAQELAQRMGLPAQALQRSLASLHASRQSPLHSVGPLEARIVITDGGLAVNGSHQVLRGDGSVIPRLYAAGAAGQGGVLLAGNGHHICWAVTSGRRAGRFAAAT